jgi:hypothetical protein
MPKRGGLILPVTCREICLGWHVDGVAARVMFDLLIPFVKEGLKGEEETGKSACDMRGYFRRFYFLLYSSWH